jgi:hypothetical protein
MSTLAGKLIRLACNEESSSDTLDPDTGLAPTLWRGCGAKIQCALFVGEPSSTTFITDTSNITSVELLVRLNDSGGTLLLDKVVLDAAITNSTYAIWTAGTGQQFEFALTADDTSWETLSDGLLHLYFSIVANTASGPFVVAKGEMLLQDTGIVGITAPEVPSGYFEVVPAATGSINIQSMLGQAVVHVRPQAALTPYTYIIVLLTTNVLPSALTDMYIEMDLTNVLITIQVRNDSSSGGVIHTAFSDSSNDVDQHVQFRFNGTSWIKFGKEIA